MIDWLRVRKSRHQTRYQIKKRHSPKTGKCPEILGITRINVY